uniref:Polycomb group protein: Posterior sex combs n=1 Tax=Drosophila subobscura TaxID=7241 RepID=A0A4Q8K1L1_DROSU|nr:Polycomb group protein: Posterior sex combs [Drosophila subobscura]
MANTQKPAAASQPSAVAAAKSSAVGNGSKKLALSLKAPTTTTTATTKTATTATATNVTSTSADKMQMQQRQQQQQPQQQLFAASNIKVKSENTLTAATATVATTTKTTTATTVAAATAKNMLEKSIKKESTPPATTPNVESVEAPASSSASCCSSSAWSTTTATSEDASSNGGASADEEAADTSDLAAPGTALGTATTPRPVLLTAVNPHIICHLCQGYLINATTIVECLHSFCHSCLINHLRKERFCPRCEMVINSAKPNIKSDTTLQAIVYKLVPGLYERELMRKRAFYKDRPQEAALATPEQRGDDTEHLIFGPTDNMSLSLEYAELGELSTESEVEFLRPRYLQCPAMCRVSHLKKFVYDKFDIDVQRFSIDIMYKVKTIVLLDYYTLMDIAYIYTWKRDAPMRFYFRVYESPQRQVKPAPRRVLPAPLKVVKQEPAPEEAKVEQITPPAAASPPAIIKQEQQEEIRVPSEQPLKLIINRNMLEKREKSHSPQSSRSSAKNNHHTPTTPSSSSSSSACPSPSGELNIKLKIDLSKHNSVTIINMSDPERKEIVKPLKPEKESRSKNRSKDKDGSPKSSSSSSSSNFDRKRKSPSPLTVPPLTIRTERILSPSGVSTLSPRCVASTVSYEDPKSEFLKSFALTPIKVKVESPERPSSSSHRAPTPPKTTVSRSGSHSHNSGRSKGSLEDRELMRPPAGMAPKSIASKRKSKEPVKAISKKPKLSPPLPREDFKIRLPATNTNSQPPKSPSTPPPFVGSLEKLMPPPPKPPLLPSRKPQLAPQFSPSSPLHPGMQMAAPGNRTPIAKRYHPILPKAARPNPFANIPNEVNRLLKDAGTEIKSIGGNTSASSSAKSHVYGPKTDTKMGPPPPPAGAAAANAGRQTSGGHAKSGGNNQPQPHASPSSNGGQNKAATNYLNLALFNASKSKGREAPPGCRTPMYTPNSPIYSPSSPQYVPNYNIPTMPTYKYTPKPSQATAGGYLQSMLGGSGSGGSMSGSLFPSPPTKSDQNTNPAGAAPSSGHAFQRGASPNNNEDAPEKQQVKVKSLLNSCNINIPSSLSITISRDNGDSSSASNGSHPKHKSPVNNYIEIVKLPDQPQDQGQKSAAGGATDAQKRQSPPAPTPVRTPPPVQAPAQAPAAASMRLPQPPPSKAIPSPQHLMSRMTPPQLSQTTPTSASPAAPRGITPPKISPPTSAKGTPLKPVLTPSQADAKKTPSPEKRNAAQMGSHSPTASENKSPKSAGQSTPGSATPNGDPAAKKFRPILPRQNAQIPDTAAKLPSLAPAFNFSQPQSQIQTGIKKVPTSKKSPNGGAAVFLPPLPKLPNGGHPAQKPSPPLKSQQMGAKKTTKNPTPPPSSSPSLGGGIQGNHGKLMPHPGLPGLNAPLSIASSAAAAAGQMDLNNFIKENLIRAQVAQAAQAAQAQAAVNQSSMLYNFAQIGHMSPAMYNYQQAYLMEQLTRMQRAGNEVFNDYLQKLKSAANGQQGDGDHKTIMPMLPTVTLPSPSTATSAASPKTSTLSNGKVSAASKAPSSHTPLSLAKSGSGASPRQQTAATTAAPHAAATKSK